MHQIEISYKLKQQNKVFKILVFSVFVFLVSLTIGKSIFAASVPIASSVAISGRADVGQTLTGTYTYNDVDGDIQGATTFRWLRAATSAGTYRAISGATTSTYTITASDLNQFIKFEVTPVATVSPTTGNATSSSATTAVYLLSDDFTGTTIDTTTRWSKHDSSGTNVIQSGSLTAVGNNTWGSNGVFSQSSFDRSLNDLVIETDLTYSDCSLAKGGVYYDDGTGLPVGSLFFFRNDALT